MRISIETNDSHIWTDYVSKIPEKDVSKPKKISGTEDAQSTEKSTAASDAFSEIMDAAIDKITADSSADAESGDDMTLTEIFKKASEKYGVEESLLKAVAKQESDFLPDVKSSAGAMGIMQLMPQTANAMGVSDPYDPYQNIMGGAKLLSRLLNKYHGDKSLALAAYNAGEGAVDKAGGIPDFAETKDYVPKVLEYYAEGIDVPGDTYDVKNDGEKLKEMLSDFHNHKSYDLFMKEFEQELNVVPDSTQTIYESMVSAASRAMESTLASYQKDDEQK